MCYFCIYITILTYVMFKKHIQVNFQSKIHPVLNKVRLCDKNLCSHSYRLHFLSKPCSIIKHRKNLNIKYITL